MSFYRVASSAATRTGGEGEVGELLGRAGMVAVRLADLASPARRGLGKDGRSALVAIPSAVDSPDHRQGHDLSIGLPEGVLAPKVLTRRRLPDRVCLQDRPGSSH